ncbi:hypothetical protein BGZ65_011580, partial [Modicella reniformis]
MENFVLLNQSGGSKRKIVPLTSTEEPFVSFSERELGILFWQNDTFKELVLVEFQDKSIKPNRNDLHVWLQGTALGSLITELLSDIGKDEPRKGRGGYKDSTTMMGLNRMRDHLQFIQHPSFDPGSYHKTGHVHRGSIRTDGFRLQLLVYKLKELQSVRYRRLPAEVLPPRIASTVGGCDYYLSEIRNI